MFDQKIEESLVAKKWFVVYTCSRAEKKVSRALTDLKIEHYLPLRKELRQWKDRKKWVESVLFPSYVFVFIENSNRFVLYEIPGFLKFISFCGNHTVINDEQITKIKKICNFDGAVEINTDFSIGIEVLITSGYFSGFRGQLITKGDRNRLRIEILELSCNAVIEIDKNSVQKIV